MAARVGFRLFRLSRTGGSATIRPTIRRYQSVDVAARRSTQGAFGRLWNSPVGMKTVHFWAPVMKWALVLAGVSDFARPAESLSVTQNAALTATGIIWTRWCLIIKPRNVFLAAVNFFLACVGVTQLTRIAFSQQTSSRPISEDVIKDDILNVNEAAKSSIKDEEKIA